MKIDYFELLVLIEASWNPGTILRYSIIRKAVDQWFFELSEIERGKVFNYFNRPAFKSSNDAFAKKIQDIFFCRFDPRNQYEITLNDGNGVKTLKAFQFNDSFHVSSDTRIAPEYIQSVLKIIV